MSKLFGTLFGKKDTAVQTQPTQFETLPGFGQDLLQQILSQGQGVAGQQSPFAPIPFSPQQLGALQQLQSGVRAPQIGQFNFGQRASEQFGQAGDTFGQARGFLGQAGDIGQQAAGAFDRFDPTLTSALASLQAGQAPITGEQLQQGIGEFINPFTQQVIDPALQDISNVGEARRSSLAGQVAGNLGAFGGSRQALENSALTGQIARESGRLGGQLRSQAFNTASQQALSRLTGERGRSLQAGQLGLGALGQITGRAGQLGQLGQLFGGLGGQASQIAGQQGDLGSQLFGARGGIEDIRQQLRGSDVTRLGEQFGAGEQLRGFGQQQQQIPFQQLELLSQLFGLIPQGGGGRTLRENQGALQRVGDVFEKFSSGAGNIAKAAAF